MGQFYLRTFVTVQGSILVPGLHLGCVFTRKASASSGLKQNLEPNWQLFAKMSIFDEDFRSLMLPLSLTLNYEPVNGYYLLMSDLGGLINIYIFTNQIMYNFSDLIPIFLSDVLKNI